MEEHSSSGNEPEKNAPAETSWEETKRQAQTDFGLSTDNRVVIDRIHVQRLLNAKFWENEIMHQYSMDMGKDSKIPEIDSGEPER